MKNKSLIAVTALLLAIASLLTGCAGFVKTADLLPTQLKNIPEDSTSTEVPIYKCQLPGELYPYYLPDATLDYHHEDEFEKGELKIYHTDFTVDEKTKNNIVSTIENQGFDMGFYMIDIETGASFGYNADEAYTPACTIKAGYALYVLREVALGNASMDDTIVFERKHQSLGTGYIWKMGVGAELTVRDIIQHMIHESDNVAYMMLVDHFGADGYNKLMEELGVENRITDTKKWTRISCKDLGLIWSEIYRFKDQCEEGAFLWDVATHNLYNFVSYALNDCAQLGYETIAHKSGYGEGEFNDASVVMAEHPYILVCMTQIDAKTYAFVNTCKWCDTVIKQYWDYYYNQESQNETTSNEDNKTRI